MKGEIDIGVIGGGPAGLAVAIRARQAGMSVVVLDRGRPPIDRACGEGLMPDATAHLAALGIQSPPEDSAPFVGIRYLADGLVAEGRFPRGRGLGVRRTALHAALAERAGALGAELRWGVTATALGPSRITIGGEALAVRFVAGPDARHSAVRGWSGLEGTPGKRDRHAVRRHYEIAPWSDLVEVYWGDGAEAYVAPVGPRRVGVAMLWNGSASSFDRLLDRFPALSSRLRGAPRASRDRGASRLGARPRRVVDGAVALVGDAAGGVDPITGEGVAMAFRQAAALVAALAAAGLRRYERDHRAIASRPRRMAALLLLLERRRRLRRRVIAALAADPGLFASLLAVHTGSAAGVAPLSAFARLALRMLTARPPRLPGLSDAS